MDRIDSPFSTPFKYKPKNKKHKLKKNALEKVDIEEEKRKDPKYKTELCKSFMEDNFCKYGNKCRFAHGDDELVIKEKINNYKRKLCKSFFNEGFCNYGIRCNFQHDQRKFSEIKLPFYYINLFIFQKPKLTSGKRLKVFEDITNKTNINSSNNSNVVNVENILSESTICSSIDNSPNQKKDDYKENYIEKNFSEFFQDNIYKNLNFDTNLIPNKKYKIKDEIDDNSNKKILNEEEKYILGKNIYNFIFKGINDLDINNEGNEK